MQVDDIIEKWIAETKNVIVDPKIILSLIDLTSLNHDDDNKIIETLCKKAISKYGHVAAICVYPTFVKQVTQFFAGKPVKIATVANFPDGNESWDDVEQSIHRSIINGATEIDVVFPYSQFLSGDKVGAHKFIRHCKDVCGKQILLKVILETGLFNALSLIEEISRSSLLAGADFLKTSTGKIPVGATLEAAAIMLMVIKELSAQSPRPLGFKVSGGVRTIEQASQYIALASKIMGTAWVTPEHFRIGASQLVDTIIK